MSRAPVDLWGGSPGDPWASSALAPEGGRILTLRPDAGPALTGRPPGRRRARGRGVALVLFALAALVAAACLLGALHP